MLRISVHDNTSTGSLSRRPNEHKNRNIFDTTIKQLVVVIFFHLLTLRKSSAQFIVKALSPLFTISIYHLEAKFSDKSISHLRRFAIEKKIYTPAIALCIAQS